MATKKTTPTTTKKITEPEPLPIDTSDEETPVEVPRKKMQFSAVDELLALAATFSANAAERRSNASKSNGIGAHVENVAAETLDVVVAKIRARAAEL